MKVPILRLKDILLTSIQVDLTDEDALTFQSDLLQMVNEKDAKGIVIDITALDVVDSYMARMLNETASMVRVLGAEVVICGMQPSVALTLVEMGRELMGVATALNLDQGYDMIQGLLEDEGDSP
jgi:rsbT antagonist protein RsbS